jgi:hypothetical protein
MTTASSGATTPIVPGFYPDPTVCRIGDDYYLAHSSFECFPGVPIWHSRDLLRWTQIGHVLTRRSQLARLERRGSSALWAGTLRHHGGSPRRNDDCANGQGQCGRCRADAVVRHRCGQVLLAVDHWVGVQRIEAVGCHLNQAAGLGHCALRGRSGTGGYRHSAAAAKFAESVAQDGGAGRDGDVGEYDIEIADASRRRDPVIVSVESVRVPVVDSQHRALGRQPPLSWIRPEACWSCPRRVAPGNAKGSAGLLCCRVRDLRWSAEATLEGSGRFLLRVDDRHAYGLGRHEDQIAAAACIGDLDVVLAGVPVPAGPVTLRIESVPARSSSLPLAGPDDIVLSFAGPDGWQELARLDGRYLSTEVATGFTGRMLALAATEVPARVRSVTYRAESPDV